MPIGDWLTIRPIDCTERHRRRHPVFDLRIFACPIAMQQRSDLAKNASCAGALDGHDERPFVRCKRDAPTRSSMIGLVLVTHGRLAVEFRARPATVARRRTQKRTVTM